MSGTRLSAISEKDDEDAIKRDDEGTTRENDEQTAHKENELTIQNNNGLTIQTDNERTITRDEADILAFLSRWDPRMAPTPPPVSPSTPGSKEKKSKQFFSALKKHSSDFIDSFKRHESQVQGYRSTSTQAHRWLGIPEGTREERRAQFDIDRILEVMDRGPYWWERITRAEQDRIAYQDSDSIESLARGLQADEEETDLYFRCDIHAEGRTKFAKIRKECRQLVVAAGGTLLDEIEDIGGFLYSFPNDDSTIDPLTNGDETLYTGHIRIESWMIALRARKGVTPVYEAGASGASPRSGNDSSLTASPTAKTKMQAWIAEQRIKADKAAAEAQRVKQALEDDEVVLSPRILDAGVELAILDPGRLLQSSSEMRLGVPHEGSVMEVASQDEEVAVLRSAETAVRARPRLVNVTRTFGQEMRQVESLYRDWVPSMSRACSRQGGESP